MSVKQEINKWSEMKKNKYGFQIHKTYAYYC